MSSDEDDVDVEVREQSNEEENKDENGKEIKIRMKKINVDQTTFVPVVRHS